MSANNPFSSKQDPSGGAAKDQNTRKIKGEHEKRGGEGGRSSSNYAFLKRQAHANCVNANYKLLDEFPIFTAQPCG
jgi:hypothetical protein